MRFTQITFRHMARSDAIGERIRELSGRLEDRYPGIQRCRVIVEESGEATRERMYDVAVEVRVPDGDITGAARGREIDLVLRDAFGDAERKLRESAMAADAGASKG